jgi:hypothetical protein
VRRDRLRRIEDLRRAIDCLPERTKHAMLEGIAANTIIVGAYSDRRGGVCPMLAAHRHGGRTDLLAFAHAWDRFCGARRPRRATERELAVLKAHLEASLYEASRTDLAAAIADHQAAARERRAEEARRLGLGWLRRRAAEGPADREPAGGAETGRRAAAQLL